MKRRRLRARIGGQRMIIEIYRCPCGGTTEVARIPPQRRPMGHRKTIRCGQCRLYTEHKKVV